jgi:protein-disulfide isomerase
MSAKHGLALFWVLLCVLGCSQKASEKKENAPFPTRGDENAPYIIEQFSDFYCPFCKEQARVFKKVAETYPGKLRMIFRHFPLAGEEEQGSFSLHEAAACADEQGKFWDFHDFIFAEDRHPAVAEAARAAGLNQGKLDECLASRRGRTVVLADSADAQTRGISGAPTFFINGEKVVGLRAFDFFAEELDPEFAERKRVQREADYQALLKKIDFSEAGRPVQGAENASVTITEFSDFHCFFCKQLTPALEQLMELYPGKIRRIWRHFPLPIHPQAPFAHLASECAHQQGKFWEIHEKVFSDPEKAKTQEDFERISSEVGLDPALFKDCYENPESRKKVENDIWLGFSKRVGSTPSLLIQDELVVGAKSLEDLKAIIDRKLAES